MGADSPVVVDSPARGAAAGRTATGTGTSSQSTDLTIADAAALLAPNAAPAIADVAPVISVTSVTGAYTGVTHTVSSFVGTTPSYLPINNWTISNGSSFSDTDYTNHNDVAVIGTTEADDLFGTPAAAVGKTAQFNGKNFVILGVLTSKGSSGFQDQDDIVIIPLTTAQDEFSGVTASLNSIIVRAKSAGLVNTAQTQVYSVLDARHDVTSTESRLHRAKRVVDRRDRNLIDQDVDRVTGCRSCAEPARRRHRRHEHHAGHRHRANA